MRVFLNATALSTGIVGKMRVCLTYRVVSRDRYNNLYGTDSYDKYVDGFISTVKPDILSYDCYPGPVKSEMDLFHFNLQLMRNKSLAAKIPLWTYIWLESNGRGHGAGFYRWQLFIAAAHGVRGIMQWSVSPCGKDPCGPRARFAPYPCLLDKHGNQFKPVADMARVEHQKLLALGPLLLEMTSVQVVSHRLTRTTSQC